MTATFPYALHAQAPIGVFDSGVGGLSVLNEICATLPNERFVYVADTQYMPYGSQPPPVIAQRAAALVRYLQRSHGVKAIVVACNTSAAVLGDQLERFFPEQMPWVDPISPVLKALIAPTSPSGPTLRTVGLLATPGTVASGRHQALLAKLEPSSLIHLLPMPCDGLAAMVEHGEHLPGSPHYQNCLNLLRVTLCAERINSMDALILGCTHYPHAEAAIKTVLAEAGRPDILLINPARTMATRLKAHLQTQNLLADSSILRPNRFYVTADPRMFFTTANQLLLQHIAVSAVNPLSSLEQGKKTGSA